MSPTNAELDAAFSALKTYHSGSSRAALMPIDKAAGTLSWDAALQKSLERRLIAALGEPLSGEAKEYACRKLGWIGTAASVPVLAGLLVDPGLSEAARQALQAVPGPEATRALCDALKQPRTLHRVGLVNSLGMRNAASAVPVLTALLKDPNSQIAAAAAAALGHIGSSKAARALEKFLPKAADTIRPVVADACLVCAEQCIKAGRPALAESLYQILSRSAVPIPIQQAAQRGLRRVANSP